MRILMAEDDAALASFVRQGLQAEHYTVDIAEDGERARAMGSEIDYDLVILDLNLPRVDGVAVLRHLRLKRPTLPVLVLTLRSRVEDRVQCLDTGADDYVPKKLSSTSLDILHLQDDLIAKIKAAAESRHSHETFRVPRKPSRSVTIPMPTAPLCAPAIIALGISTGGPKALQEILPVLPADIPVPILVVQHMPAGFTAPFAKRLNDLCAVSVCEAEHGRAILPGMVYIAPAGTHLTVQRSSRTSICLSDKPENQLHVPSVDIMMQSVATAFGSQAMGIIMTGMGSDGLQGMSAIHREGGLTVGQDEPSCAVYGMPRACAEMGILDRVVPLARIPYEILQATHYAKPA
ncbi:MAG TPA: chemotaxis-specific protein-glutamate methyltransferase CheB [Candidatus Sulfotelmatobacter sp.]|jgi:two-component system chemotaxis response regulator CheB|nr:chemotaxis-specific protein-glutamate methyltransferase CheB [Candidatus Sulfotelmatobacter sp.]